MSSSPIGTKRLSSDLPTELYERLERAAKEPPAISVAEYARRLIALKFDYPLPRASEREEKGLTVTGIPKRRPGRRPKQLFADIAEAVADVAVEID